MAAVVGGGPQDEIPEADAVEQGRAVDFDDEAGLDTAYLSGGAGDRDASEAEPSTAPGHPAVGVVARRGRSQC